MPKRRNTANPRSATDGRFRSHPLRPPVRPRPPTHPGPCVCPCPGCRRVLVSLYDVRDLLRLPFQHTGRGTCRSEETVGVGVPWYMDQGECWSPVEVHREIRRGLRNQRLYCSESQGGGCRTSSVGRVFTSSRGGVDLHFGRGPSVTEGGRRRVTPSHVPRGHRRGPASTGNDGPVTTPLAGARLRRV